MDTSPILVWFGLGKTVVYGACAIVALAYYLHPPHRARAPRPFGYSVLGLFLMTAGESLGWAWHPFSLQTPVLPAIGSVVLIVGAAVTVATVIAVSVVYRRTVATLGNHALTDPLTGLCNRRAFFEALETRLARARAVTGIGLRWPCSTWTT